MELTEEQVLKIWREQALLAVDGPVHVLNFARALSTALRAQADAQPVAEWQTRYIGDPRQPGTWTRAQSAENAKRVYDECPDHTDEYGWQVRPLYIHPAEAAASGLSKSPLYVFAQECVLGAYKESELAGAATKALTRASASASAATVAEPSDMRDAYVGAREDVEIWKRRALEAEELNRKFIASINGPTHMGEPVVLAITPVGNSSSNRKYPIEYKGVAAQQQAEPRKFAVSEEWLSKRLAIADDADCAAGQPEQKRPCDMPPGCNGNNCLGCGEQQAEPGADERAAFDKLKLAAETLRRESKDQCQTKHIVHAMTLDTVAGWIERYIAAAQSGQLAGVAEGKFALPPAVLDALRFYAMGCHFSMHDDTAWDTVSGEPPNFWEDEAGTATVEDGSIAKAVLQGRLIEPAEEPMAPIEGEVFTSLAAAPTQQQEGSHV